MKDNIKDNILLCSKKNAKNIKYISIYDFYNNNLGNDNIYVMIRKDNTIETTYSNLIRKDIFVDIFSNKVLPYLNLKKDIIFNINFNDNCDDKGVLTYGSHSNSKSVLIPDINQMQSYPNFNLINDNIDFISNLLLY
jgi:hypothetical protein